MDYSGTIASANVMKIVLESNRRMIDRFNESTRIAIAHAVSQNIAPIIDAANKATKNLKPLLPQSTLQAIVKVQSEQIAILNESFTNISKLYRNVQYNSDEEIQLDTDEIRLDADEVEVPYSVEAKARHLNIWLELVSNHPKVASLIGLLFVHYVSDPMWNFVDTHYMFQIFSKLLKWVVQFINVP
ncbi:hypothetical protein [Weissella cibaria]|nr:hypothetical protein [Weissella cibaria]